MITPKAGELIRDLGFVIDIDNDLIWVEDNKPYIKFLGWHDPGHGICWTVQRDVEDNDLITDQAEIEKFFDRAISELEEYIGYLQDALDMIEKEAQK